MSEANLDSAEIDLQPVEDITDFSDNEQIPVERINFEFEQLDKRRGSYRKITIFNDTHCYQSTKDKHQRKFKYRIDIAYLDPRPFRERTIAWKWLYASLSLFGLAVVLLMTGWLDQPTLNSMGLFIGALVVAAMTLLAFFHYSQDKVYFRSQQGGVRLIELINKNPDIEQFRNFINKFIMQIKKAKTAKQYNQNKFLARELQELRRLKDETVVAEDDYEVAKRRIFKHEAFRSAE